MANLSDYFKVENNMIFLGETTLSSANADITLSGLITTQYRFIQFRAMLKNNTGIGSEINLYFNGDTTATNYYSRRISNATASGVINSAYILTLSASDYINIIGESSFDINNDIRTFVNAPEDSATSLNARFGSHLWTTAANITSITFNSNQASGLAIGSKLFAYGIK
jgi:hypothetical protein